jgi:hypothetical protein
MYTPCGRDERTVMVTAESRVGAQHGASALTLQAYIADKHTAGGGYIYFRPLSWVISIDLAAATTTDTSS